MRMKSGGALAIMLVCLGGLIACSSSRNINSNSSGFVWVTTQGDQKVTSYAVNLSTGATSKIGSPAATGIQPAAIAMTPDRKALFVANAGDNTISAYTINNDASLKAAGSPVPVPGQQPVAIAIDPSGALVFVANEASGTVSVFSASGATLTPATLNGGVTSCAFPNANSFSPNPNTTSFTLNNSNTGNLSSYSITGNVATLTFSGAVSSAFSTCGRVSISGVASPDNFLNGSWTILGTPTTTQITININHADVGSTGITGSAAELIPNPGPVAVMVAPAGGFLYIANQLDNTVTGFAYSNSSGNVTIGNQVPNSPFLVGTSPAGLAFSRCAGFTQATAVCPAADGNNLFVANSGSNNVSLYTACIQVIPSCPAADGTLIPLAGSPVGAGISPTSFIVNPVADFLYVVDSKSNEVSQYKYSPATGALTPLNTPTVSTSTTPGPGGITSDGSVVLVPDTGGSTLSVFKASSVVSSAGTAPSGKLSPANPTSVPLSGQPSAVLVR